jgi:hypothetical protein
MSVFDTTIFQNILPARKTPFEPTADIGETDTQRAIERVQGNAVTDLAALAANDILVKTASSTLSAERVVTDTSTISVDWATAGQAKFNWLGLVTDTDPELGGHLDLNNFNITGTGNINITGTGAFSGDVTVPDEAYHATDWNGSLEVPTKNAVRDKVELILSNYASNSNALGASLIGIEDSGGYFSQTNVETALAYVGQRVADLDSAVVLRGTWAANAGTFPGGGTAQAGSSYIVSVAGTVDSVAFAIGDRIIAITDNASTATFAANWFKADYTDLVSSVAGKTGAVTLATGDIAGVTTDRLLGRDTAGSGVAEELTVGGGVEFTGSGGVQRSALTGAVTASAGSNTTAMTFDLVVCMGGSSLATGIVKGCDFHADFAFTITGWTIFGDASGAIVVDVWKDTYANFPPTVADTIAGSEKPTITATGVKGQDTSLSTWTTSVAAGDVLRFNVDSVTTIVAATLILKCTKTS